MLMLQIMSNSFEGECAVHIMIAKGIYIQPNLE